MMTTIKFVEDEFEYIPQLEGIEGAYKIAELAARTCYRSENLIKEGSYHRIIDDVCIKNGHTSVTEFATIYLKTSILNIKTIIKYIKDRYSRVRFHGVSAYITTTLRTIIQGDYKDPVEAIQNHFDKDWKDDFKYWCEPTDYHHKRYCYRFSCDRVGSQSFMRHRGIWGISYAQESTRYCNYNGKKFGGEIRISLPSKFYDVADKVVKKLNSDDREWFYNEATLDEKIEFLCDMDEGWKIYVEGLEHDAEEYINLIKLGWKPEDARGKLPLDIATTFMMCAYKEDWKMFMFRRNSPHAHPHIQKIAELMKADLIKRGIIKA